MRSGGEYAGLSLTILGFILVFVGYLLRYVQKQDRNLEDHHKLAIAGVYTLGNAIVNVEGLSYNWFFLVFSIVWYGWVLGNLFKFYPLPKPTSLTWGKDL